MDTIEYGKKYRVVSSNDLYGNDTNGWVITPLTEEDAAKMVGFPISLGVDFPQNTSDDRWMGDFIVLEVPDSNEALRYSKAQAIEPGDWITYCSVELEEIE